MKYIIKVLLAVTFMLSTSALATIEGNSTSITNPEIKKFLLDTIPIEFIRHTGPEHRWTFNAEKAPFVYRDNDFWLMTHEVTNAIWRQCVNDGQCQTDEANVFMTNPDYESHAVTGVSQDMIVNQFIPWITKKLDGYFRLPQQNEIAWAMTRGKAQPYSWGHRITCDMAAFGFHEKRSENDVICDNLSTEIKRYPPTVMGVYDLHGNVAEWTASCGTYNNEKAYLTTGGSLFSSAESLSVTKPNIVPASYQLPALGFRLVMLLPHKS